MKKLGTALTLLLALSIACSGQTISLGTPRPTLSPTDLYKELLGAAWAPENVPAGLIWRGNRQGELSAGDKTFNAVGSAASAFNLSGGSDGAVAALTFIVFPTESDALGGLRAAKAALVDTKPVPGVDAPSFMVTLERGAARASAAIAVVGNAAVGIIMPAHDGASAGEARTSLLVAGALRHLAQVRAR